MNRTWNGWSKKEFLSFVCLFICLIAHFQSTREKKSFLCRIENGKQCCCFFVRCSFHLFLSNFVCCWHVFFLIFLPRLQEGKIRVINYFLSLHFLSAIPHFTSSIGSEYISIKKTKEWRKKACHSLSMLMFWAVESGTSILIWLTKRSSAFNSDSFLWHKSNQLLLRYLFLSFPLSLFMCAWFFRLRLWHMHVTHKFKDQPKTTINRMKFNACFVTFTEQTKEKKEKNYLLIIYYGYGVILFDFPFFISLYCSFHFTFCM